MGSDQTCALVHHHARFNGRGASRHAGCHEYAPTAASAANAGRTAISPSSAHAHLTGIGLASTNSLLCSGSSALLSSRARGRFAGERRRAHFVHQPRRDVGGHRNHAVAAQQHERQRRWHRRRCRRRSPSARAAAGRLPRSMLAGGVLDADDAGHLGQAQHGVVGRSATVRPGTL